jgi:serine/threonine protein kinase
MRVRYFAQSSGGDKLVPVAYPRDRAPTLFDSCPRRVVGVGPSETPSTLRRDGATRDPHFRTRWAPAYRLERELEAGGMSRLFLATDVKLNRQVVVKVLPPDLVSTASIARFKRENRADGAAAASRTSCPF